MKGAGKFVALAVGLMLLFGASVAQASSFEYFDGLPTPNTGGGVSDWGTIPNPYNGFNWGGMEVTKGSTGGNDYMTVYSNSSANIPSPPNVAYNGGDGLQVVTVTRGEAFDFLGAYFSTWARNNAFWGGVSATSVQIDGYAGATLVHSDTVQLTTNFVQYDASGFTGIDTLKFTSNAAGLYYLLDNFKYDIPPSNNVPEPATMLLLGFGLVGVAGARRFKK